MSKPKGEVEEEKKGETTKNDNVLNVSYKRNMNFYVNLSKNYLKDFASIELHALGEATTIAVQVAENLERHQYATLKSIHTETVQLPRREGGEVRKAKLFIVLEKSSKFEEKVELFNKIKEENERNLGAKRPPKAAAETK